MSFSPFPAATKRPHPLRTVRIITVLIFLAMFFGSHGPHTGIDDQIKVNDTGLYFPKDKIVHFLAYSLLTYLIARSRFFGPQLAPNLVLATLLVSTYGAIDEITQGWVGRDSEFADFLTDIIAAFSTLIALWPATGKRPSLPNSTLRYAFCALATSLIPTIAFLQRLSGHSVDLSLIDRREMIVTAGLVLASVYLVITTWDAATRAR